MQIIFCLSKNINIFLEKIYDLIFNIKMGEIEFYDLKIIGLILLLILTVILVLIGYKMSKKKNRNPFLWTLLIVFFNFWAILYLYSLPSKKKLKNSKT